MRYRILAGVSLLVITGLAHAAGADPVGPFIQTLIVNWYVPGLPNSLETARD